MSEQHDEHVKAYQIMLVKGIYVAKKAGDTMQKLKARSPMHRHPCVDFIWDLIVAGSRTRARG